MIVLEKQAIWNINLPFQSDPSARKKWEFEKGGNEDPL